MSASTAPLQAALEETVASGWCPGLVAGVRRRGETEVFATGALSFGDGAPMLDGTPFRIASLSKPIGGALALSMVADGTLSLDAPVTRWLPELADPRVLARPDAELRFAVPARRPITVRDLLTFTAGMGIDFAPTPYAEATRDFIWGPNPPAMGPDEYLARLGALPLAHQPGERWMYHACADVLSVLLARAADRPLGTVLEERITGPLGMASTGFPTGTEALPTVYEPSAAGLVEAASYREALAGPPVFPSLAGGLLSSVPDYLAFLAALADDSLLPPGLRRQMTSGQLTPGQRAGLAEMSGEDQSWGFMVAVQTGRGEPWSEPGMWGWAGGSGTSAAVYPDGDIGVVFTQRFLAGPADSFDYFWEPFGRVR